ncbi:ABC transporter permease [Gordonia alkanivorans]|uniref:ABC transporter permease n=1 Tax=Gordonia sp. Swx-4 TaxID=3029399 RepID=UPI0021CB6484|nr:MULTISPECIES: ABC transporter permease [Gordonia]MDH3008155.1 ABC transporter permease [Gordonia alkanivorans]MDH3017097.1 ABC transporter permease [Gordonia alkanivorans]MDH3021169.1 ABC transporter permease [Gordonia alkanivorans]MDH3042342.1 ABC transporter permease [Gordonia alkanivorans]MDH3046530.1 ABC transporter permease [Gordonia alkanivorans]
MVESAVLDADVVTTQTRAATEPVAGTPRPAPERPFGTVEHTRRPTRSRTVLRLLGRRILVMIPTVLLVSLGVFAVAAASPFDPLTAHLGDNYQSATQAQRGAVTQAYGLDDHWFAAWWKWWVAVFQGDLGWSSTMRQSVADVIGQGLPFTLGMSLAALLSAAAVAIALGAVIGMRRGGLLDRACTALAAILAATPPFVVSLVLVSAFAVGLGWFPTSGARRPGDDYSFDGLITHAVLPYLALTISMIPWLLLTMRSAVVDAAASDAVRGARARGVGGWTLLRGHVVPVSVLPTLALLGTRSPELIAGAAIVETVFGWPGLAEALVDSAVALDFSLLAPLAVGSVVLVLIGSALSDAAAVWIDPRIGLRA